MKLAAIGYDDLIDEKKKISLAEDLSTRLYLNFVESRNLKEDFETYNRKVCESLEDLWKIYETKGLDSEIKQKIYAIVNKLHNLTTGENLDLRERSS